MSVLKANGEMPLYQEVADRMARLIEEGTFRVGDRIPSVRGLHRDWGVSITTAMEAYRQLENRGLIEARPQSGYYVRPRLSRMLKEPQTTAPECTPCTVSQDKLMLSIVRDMGNAKLHQFGAAIPNPDMLPIEKLNRIMATSMRRVGRRGISYVRSEGLAELRTELARRAVMAGCALTPEDFIVTNGATEAISLALRAVCKPGDAVAIESPAFFGTLRIIEGLGLRVLEIPTCPREGISLTALKYALGQHDIKAVICSPNFSNPTGGSMTEEDKGGLVALLGRMGIPLIEDDIYGDLPYDGERPRSAKSYDRNGGVILCSSVSKTLAPGWRIGWIAPGRWREAVERLKIQTNFSSAAPTQFAIAAFLAEGGYDHHLRRMRRALAKQNEWLQELVAESFPTDCRMTRPRGGYVLWVELEDHIDSVQLYEKAARAGVTFAPGVMFSSKGDYRNCLRLNSAFLTEDSRGGIETLGQLIREY